MLKEIERLMAQQFHLKVKNLKYYEEAFTHSSYLHENKQCPTPHNERMEFLGDAVIDLLVTDYLYRHFPQMAEGELSRLRAAMVCEESLSKRAVECHLNQVARLGHGEEMNGGRSRPSLLCDLFEAVCGAVYLDLGLEAVSMVLEKALYPLIAKGSFVEKPDPKTALQELVQAEDGMSRITYQVIGESGPPHKKQFQMAVFRDGQKIGQGSGRSKKAAEMQAAQNALMDLTRHNRS